MPRNIYLTMIMISGYAPTFPDSCYHLIYYWPAAVDILATVVTSIRKRFHLHSFNLSCAPCARLISPGVG
ncbi:hypothetical protein EA251_24845 [Escherichia coli]|nr:hypothetical protein EA251_24845 [Escherichia coli]